MRVLIANRGEISVRIQRSCREMGIPTVAVYSDADRLALHVRLADEAIYLGPAPAAESYLRQDRILEAAERTGATAIHPGYGFLSENADFARAVQDAGMTWIGPSPAVIDKMGSKTESREVMHRAGVPIVPGLRRPLSGSDELVNFAEAHGFPLLLKATAGGGGKGMRRLDEGDDLQAAFQRASAEAVAYFGDGDMYVERYLSQPRHIEVQILGDRHGNLIHLGERECSIQRRHQKVIEECPSPVVDPDLRRRLGEAALLAGRAVDYDSAGTVEFLLDDTGSFYFLEVNTRLQVEHPVTEMVTGTDLVREMIQVARGDELELTQEEVRFDGHAIECRIYAEDPWEGFRPSPGLIRGVRLPEGPGIRNDSGIVAGWEVPLDYDPMLAKLIAWGPDRGSAIARLQGALTEYRIDGLETSISFFQDLLATEKFRSADFDTHFIDELLDGGLSRGNNRRNETIALAIAAIERYRESTTSRPVDATSSGQISNWRRQGRTMRTR